MAPGVQRQALAGPVAPNAIVGGKTMGEWSAEWWKWALSFPNATNPLNDTSGALASLGDVPGPVFFVGGHDDIAFQVPTNKYLFFPLITSVFVVEPAFGDTLADGQAFVSDDFANMTNLHAELDGVPIANLASYGVFSPVFSATIPADGFAGFDQGTFSEVVASGYWLMLEPLTAGQHSLVFGGSVFDFDIETRASINAVPEPSSLILTLFGLGVVGWRTSPLARRR